MEPSHLAQASREERQARDEESTPQHFCSREFQGIKDASLRKGYAETRGTANLAFGAIRGGAASAFAIQAIAAAAMSVALAATTVVCAPSTACLRLARQPEGGQRHTGKTGAEFLERLPPRY
jgi:hypothetical protein